MDTSSPRWSAVIPQERLSGHGRPEALAQKILRDRRIQSNDVLLSQFMNEEAAWAAPCASPLVPKMSLRGGPQGAPGEADACRGPAAGLPLTQTSAGQ